MKTKKPLKTDLPTKLLIAFAVLLGAVYIINILTTAGITALVNEKTVAFKEASRPVELEVSLIVDDHCSDCTDLAPLMAQLKQFDFVTVVKENTLSFSSQEAKELINRAGIEKIPTVVVSGDINNQKVTPLWDNNWRTQNIGSPDALAVFKAVPAPYTDAASGQIIGLVSATMIVDTTCDKCFDMNQLTGLFERMGVTFLEIQTLAFGSPNANELIQTHGIQSIPALLVSNNILVYPSAAQFLGQLDANQQNGFFALHSVFPPYKQITTSEIAGLVDVIYLDDNSCSNCYDIATARNVLAQLGIAPNSESTFDVSSEKGKELIEKYAITSVPTMILSPDAQLYVRRVWDQVGSVEKDGWHVWRKSEVIGTVRDLNSNPSDSAPNAPAATQPVEITVEGTEFKYTPSGLTVAQGETVRINFKNTGGALHDLFIEELGIKTELLAPGNSETIEFVADKAGTFAFYCTVPGHKEAGMTGTLTVS